MGWPKTPSTACPTPGQRCEGRRLSVLRLRWVGHLFIRSEARLPLNTPKVPVDRGRISSLWKSTLAVAIFPSGAHRCAHRCALDPRPKGCQRAPRNWPARQLHIGPSHHLLQDQLHLGQAVLASAAHTTLSPLRKTKELQPIIWNMYNISKT